MKKFNFRLRRVLDYRQLVKKESEREFARKATELKTREQELQAIIEAQDKAVLKPTKEMTMAEFSLVESYQERLQEALVEQRVLVNEAAKAVDEARDHYIKKSIEKEILDKLKKRKLEEYKMDSKREERKERDEMTVQRHRFPKPGQQKKEDK